MENKFTKSGDILVKYDQNNVIYIDPNTVMSNGVPQQRGVEPEELMVYVNLEADLIPRTTLIAGNESNTITSIAKGSLNFLQNPSGKDYDSTWTDAFINTTEKKVKDDKIDTPTSIFEQYDKTAQTFGIEDVNIRITGTNFIPQISIKFVDVRGKTLFESPENSPYKAFFHLPWPIFYLTVKGYYGKAIRYRLHMVSFNSAYNSETGNFDIDTVFVGSTYAFLNDIPLAGILNAPYMFGIEQSKNAKFNENTGYYEKVLLKTSVGYITLKSVYDEYKSKGLLPQNFPVKTLREISIIARRLNKILEDEIFHEIVDPKILSGVSDFEKLIDGFYDSANFWGQKHLSSEIKKVDGKDLYKLIDKDENSMQIVTGDTSGSLEEIIKNYTKQLEGNQAFGIKRDEDLIKADNLEIIEISLINVQTIKDFYRVIDKEILIDREKLLSNINIIRRDFVTQRNKLEETLQKKMNEIVKNPDKGFGFEPTIRNIIGVVCANADTYIRLLKDVHLKAFKEADERQKILEGVLTDSVGNDNIYPWPEIKVDAVGAKQNVLMYPGAISLHEKLQTDDKVLWPEVDFVEEYNAVSTYKVDPLTEKEGTSDIVTYVYETDTEELATSDLTTLTHLSGTVPYYDKALSSILYEIWERAGYTTAFESFSSNTIQELAEREFDNIQAQLKEAYTSIEILKQQVTGTTSLQTLMYSYSPFERWPYRQSQLPTVSYISETIDNDFSVEDYTISEKTIDYGEKYTKLKDNLGVYISEDYRKRIYPFNSTTYKTYLPSGTFGKNELNLHGTLGLTTNDGFISSPIELDWVKSGYQSNLFTQDLKINGYDKHIVNTPYFHKQLYNDFNNSKLTGKYISSAYLLLNSIPFKDLDDTINHNGNDVLMSTLFREIGATHFIPYHLMLKWGSIYYRYKRNIEYDEDIIEDITEPINTDIFFDNTQDRIYTINSINVNRTNKNNIGLYPLYQSIFHQIIHDYTFYDQTAVDAPTKYAEAVTAGNIITYERYMNSNYGWTSYINNSKYESTQTGYTFLPSNGKCVYNELGDYVASEQDNFRLLWNTETEDNNIVEYTGQTFPTYNQYFKGTDNTYSLSNNNKKVIDLIATFKPDILDIFEQAFLDFSSQILDEEVPYLPYNVKYYSFQTLLKGMSYVSENVSDLIEQDKITKKLIDKQNQNLIDITEDMLSNDSLIKLTLANPKEMDLYSLYGFTGVDSDNFDVGEFFSSQLTPENLAYIELYLGEDMDLYYRNFFSTNNIALNETNIKSLRYLIYIYAGAEAANINVTNKDVFISYLIDNVINKASVATAVDSDSGGVLQRRNLFLETLIRKFSGLEAAKYDRELTISRGYNDDPLKLELYDYFKSFNDKWVAGNSLGQRTLMEEFLFLDKANRDIGDEVYLSMDRIIAILEQKNYGKVNLFSLVNLLIKNSGFDLRPLPSYVNFYGTNFSKTQRIMPSKTVAENLFGTFLEVDYQESSPRILLQYTGPTSKHLEMSDIDRDSKFENDTFDMSNVNNNPLIVAPDVFRNIDFARSNKAVAFEVSFGDKAQSLFKGLELNQSTIRNTSESFQVLENLGSSESGSSTAQIDIGLFDIYRTASYNCTVSAMGNLMIQPTMFFYLKNVPMFRGSYWITEVNHKIHNNGIDTTFMGSRIPIQSLPDPKDSFLASYRALFDIITKKAIAKVNQDYYTLKDVTQYEEPFEDSNGRTHIINRAGIEITGEKLITESGIKEYGIPYNGFHDEKYVQLIKFNGEKWLRGTVIQMGHEPLNSIEDHVTMDIISNYESPTGAQKEVNWGDIKGTTATQSFYGCRFSNKHIFRPTSNAVLNEYKKTEFLNPDKPANTVTIDTNFDHTTGKYTGPVKIGPPTIYGIAMSEKLMADLGVWNGDVVYFNLIP